jgi:hypothetical protein
VLWGGGGAISLPPPLKKIFTDKNMNAEEFLLLIENFNYILKDTSEMLGIQDLMNCFIQYAFLITEKLNLRNL